MRRESVIGDTPSENEKSFFTTGYELRTMMNGTVGDSRVFSVRHMVLTGMVRDRKYVSVTAKVCKRMKEMTKYRRSDVQLQTCKIYVEWEPF